MVAAVDVGRDVGPQVEQVVALRPEREPGATALDDVGRGAGLHLSGRGFLDIGLDLRFSAVVDADVGMAGVELLQQADHHRGEPGLAAVLVDKLGLPARVAGGRRGERGPRAGGQGCPGCRTPHEAEEGAT